MQSAGCEPAHGTSNAEQQPGHLQLSLQTPPAQPQPTARDRGSQDSSLTYPALPWPLWGVQGWWAESLWWKSRAEEAYIRGILRRTACFHCSSCSWDHRLLLMKVAAGYILNGNTMMTQRGEKRKKKKIISIFRQTFESGTKNKKCPLLEWFILFDNVRQQSFLGCCLWAFLMLYSI